MTADPTTEWLDLCQSAGVKVYHSFSGQWIAYLTGYAETGDTKMEAIHRLHQWITKHRGQRPVFPLFHEWEAHQKKTP